MFLSKNIFLKKLKNLKIKIKLKIKNEHENKIEFELSNKDNFW